MTLRGGEKGDVFMRLREGFILLIVKDRTEGYKDDVNGDTLHLKELISGEEYAINSRSRIAETFSKIEEEYRMHYCIEQIFERVEDLWP
jgi:hypothetical protein